MVKGRHKLSPLHAKIYIERIMGDPIKDLAKTYGMTESGIRSTLSRVNWILREGEKDDIKAAVIEIYAAWLDFMKERF